MSALDGPVNGLFRLGYRSAFLLLRAWWFLRCPSAEGAAVLLWQDGALLLVRTSYRRQLDLPGGGMDKGETPLAAACRELREETGLVVSSTHLEPLGALDFGEHHRRIRTHLFRCLPAQPIGPMADGREIVWAGFMPREQLAGAGLTLLARLALALEAQPPSGTRQIS